MVVEVVQAGHLDAVFQEFFGQMKADEAGCAGYLGCFWVGTWGITPHEKMNVQRRMKKLKRMNERILGRNV